jgi:lysyl-tRNA synthetase class 2
MIQRLERRSPRANVRQEIFQDRGVITNSSQVKRRTKQREADKKKAEKAAATANLPTHSKKAKEPSEDDLNPNVGFKKHMCTIQAD